MQFFIVLSVLLSIFEPLLSAPVKYDQRQDGKINVHAKLENFLIIIAPSRGMESSSESSTGSNSLEFTFPGILASGLDFRKNLLKDIIDGSKQDDDKPVQNQATEEVATLANIESSDNTEDNQEWKLLGDAIENCGPGRYRDRLGICQFKESFRS